VESLRTGHPVTNPGQALERDMCASVVASFVENPVRGAVEFVLHPAVFAILHMDKST
jgi:hypothetical protein